MSTKENDNERVYCLGKDCPDKNCRCCRACGQIGSLMDVTDNYRESVKTGYYSSTIMRVVDPKTGKEKYFYTRPN